MRSTYSQIRFSASDLAIASSRTIQVVYAGFVCIASYRFLLGVWIEYIHVRILRTHGLRQIPGYGHRAVPTLWLTNQQFYGTHYSRLRKTR